MRELINNLKRFEDDTSVVVDCSGDPITSITISADDEFGAAVWLRGSCSGRQKYKNSLVMPKGSDLEYPHLAHCSGDRYYPPGTLGISCCCPPGWEPKQGGVVNPSQIFETVTTVFKNLRY